MADEGIHFPVWLVRLCKWFWGKRSFVWSAVLLNILLGVFAGLASAALQEKQGVRELAENPLLLTLLAVMQQNSIQLPQQRVELYSVVTCALLENRNIAKKLEPIPEEQAIKRLGPLASHLQEQNSAFARYSDVMASLVQTISVAGGTPEQITHEAVKFLKRIRERGGIFVQRMGEYFGFLHRTFQEYFAARYLLNEVDVDGLLSHWRWFGEWSLGCIGVLGDWLVETVDDLCKRGETTLTIEALERHALQPDQRARMEIEAHAGERK